MYISVESNIILYNIDSGSIDHLFRFQRLTIKDSLTLYKLKNKNDKEMI